ncbi:DUF3237 domain-containing protein [uncultured Maritimibacter sp.]|jgi:hypothetical protein|uniref:DUF3237 domain-containing protein n=1 Tax=uncultured Maritimibacter sp. TaxID=991866 RepID=UPI00261CCB10|nr:DUF3237 domain-containing protein [uncultured Maritimibacter sp.]
MTDPDPLALVHEHAFDIRINFDRRWTTGPIYGGAQLGYTSVGEGSTVTGPLLNGKLVDYSGADWPIVRADHVVELNAHYMIEASDGALIYIRNQGYVHRPLRTQGQGPDDPPDVPAYFRCTPYFKAPENGPHAWLNRTVIVGVAARKPQVGPDDPPDHSLFRYYAIR